MTDKQLENQFDFFKKGVPLKNHKKKERSKVSKIIVNTLRVLGFACVFSFANIILFINNSIISPIEFNETLTPEQQELNKKINADLKEAFNVVYKDSKGNFIRNDKGGLLYRQDVSAAQLKQYQNNINDITQRIIQNNKDVLSAQQSYDLLEDAFWISSSQKENMGKVVEARIKDLYNKTNKYIETAFNQTSYFSGVGLLGVESYQFINKVYIAEKYGYGWLKYKHQHEGLTKTDIYNLYENELDKLHKEKENEFDNLFAS